MHSATPVILSSLAVAAVVLAAPLRAQDLHEQSSIEIRRQPFRLQWVDGLSLDGPWLAAGGTNIEGFSQLAMYRRDGTKWIPHPVLTGGGIADIDGNRLVVSDGESAATQVYRLV